MGLGSPSAAVTAIAPRPSASVMANIDFIMFLWLCCCSIHRTCSSVRNRIHTSRLFNDGHDGDGGECGGTYKNRSSPVKAPQTTADSPERWAERRTHVDCEGRTLLWLCLPFVRRSWIHRPRSHSRKPAPAGQSSIGFARRFRSRSNPPTGSRDRTRSRRPIRDVRL